MPLVDMVDELGNVGVRSVVGDPDRVPKSVAHDLGMLNSHEVLH